MEMACQNYIPVNVFSGLPKGSIRFEEIVIDFFATGGRAYVSGTCIKDIVRLCTGFMPGGHSVRMGRFITERVRTTSINRRTHTFYPLLHVRYFLKKVQTETLAQAKAVGALVRIGAFMEACNALMDAGYDFQTIIDSPAAQRGEIPTPKDLMLGLPSPAELAQEESATAPADIASEMQEMQEAIKLLGAAAVSKTDFNKLIDAVAAENKDLRERLESLERIVEGLIRPRVKFISEKPAVLWRRRG